MDRDFARSGPEPALVTDITEHPTLLEFQGSLQRLLMEAGVSEALKIEFFRLLDRGGTVRAAAGAVGVSADIGFRWCR